ncbi:MAG TPA: oligopeptide transporter, OPT family [Caulobacteraceae bacterium]|nr:oligopeptide transporter, OPT family [Caulobacteraceae bacterium]
MSDTPASPRPRVELTARGLILGVIITLFFTAANVYAGLKVALTFSTSIPAAVISMAVLRAFKGSTIWENNIVQTVASAAGTLSSVIFVLPGLLMVGWWTGFPFWQSFAICAVGGVLGVMYTVPLRRALVTGSDLPYPEGVAAAEVLRAGAASAAEAEAAGEGRHGLMALLFGSLASAGVVLMTAMNLFAGEISLYGRLTPRAASGVGLSFSFLLVGIGQLMGVAVGAAMAVGLIITWGVAVPILTAAHPAAGDAAAIAVGVWKSQVKLIGAGAIAASALWTLGKLAVPVWTGLMSAIAASRRSGGRGDDVAEHDLPIWIVGLVALACLAPLAWLLSAFLAVPAGAALHGLTTLLVIGGAAYVAGVGFLVAAVCGYMAGLIGSSNSPVSGLAILGVVGAALLLVALAGGAIGPEGKRALVAFALLVTAVLVTVATVANDNLQDLKTGQLIGATPWRQQVALIVGVFAGSLVIPWTCNLLLQSNGFVGVAGPTLTGQPLQAPQATLISTLAKGVIEGGLNWTLIGVGLLVGLALVAVDETLRRTTAKLSLPPLAAALAMYLPSDVITPTILGALIGWAYDRWVGAKPWAGAAKRLGVLLASGLVVGESLMAVLLAGLAIVTGRGDPLAVLGQDPTGGHGAALGAAGCGALLIWLFLWIERLARRHTEPTLAPGR